MPHHSLLSSEDSPARLVSQRRRTCDTVTVQVIRSFAGSWAVPEEIISSWLRENKRYESLISSGFTVDDLVRLQLPIKLPPAPCW
eukprot:gene36407-47401_t